MHSVKAGTYALCIKFANYDACYPYPVFIVVDACTFSFLFLSLLFYAVANIPGQNTSASRYSRYCFYLQTFALCMAITSFISAFIIYNTARVYLPGDQLHAGFSVTGGSANALISAALLSMPYISRLKARMQLDKRQREREAAERSEVARQGAAPDPFSDRDHRSTASFSDRSSRSTASYR